MIAVTGSTGHVGRLVAQELARRGEPMKLLVRDPARAPEIANAELAQADYADPDSIAAALDEGDRVFMVSIHIGGQARLDLHRNFVEAAARARVAQLVYLSFTNAGPDAIFLHAQEHGATEQMLRDSGLPWTAMRNGMYADEIPGWFDDDRVAREPGGDARMSFSYRPELVEAIAVVLTEPGHENRVYNVTTPDSVTLEQLALIASEVTGDVYRYEPSTDDEWVERWREQGRPGWAVATGLTVYQALRAGEFDVVSDDYEQLTGREPQSIHRLTELLLAG